MARPLVVATVDSLDASASTAETADRIELRLDRMDDDPAAIVAAEWPHPLILTNRTATEGGDAVGADRLAVLANRCSDDGVWAIDVELAAVTDGLADEALAAARDASVRRIVSTHLDSVPDRDTLRDRLDAASDHGDIAKLAVPASTPEELGRLVAVTASAIDDGLPVATMAIGSHALASRVAAVGLGVPLVYGVLPDRSPVVAGQPSTALLRTVVDADRTLPLD